MKRANIIYGVLGGIILYFPLCFSGYLPLLLNVSEVKLPLREGCILISGSIAVFAISYKYSSIKYSLLRTVIMLLSLLLTFVFNVQVGTIKLLDQLLHIGERNSENMAPGLTIVLILCVVLFVSIVTNIVIPILRLIKKQDIA